MAMLIGAVLAANWIYPQVELDERQQLEARGVAISAAEGRQGTQIALPVDASQALLEEVIPLLQAVGRVVELELSGTKVTDLAPLAALLDLQKINLGPRLVPTTATTNDWTDGAPISDLTPLRRLTNLRELCLTDTQVPDAAPRTRLINLQSLLLSGTQIADATPLARLTNLRELSLADMQFADATRLAGLTNLEVLWLSDTQVADAAPLARLTNLLWLVLSGTRVSQQQVTELTRVLAERGNRSAYISGP
jgi:hypothetical protein